LDPYVLIVPDGDTRREDAVRTSHKILLRLFHDPACDFGHVSVTYINRGAPNDRSVVEGPDIVLLDRDYLEAVSGEGIRPVPYHRITEIRYRGRVIWDREGGERPL
jgi:uncharacterized protein (UPF0248 family)